MALVRTPAVLLYRWANMAFEKETTSTTTYAGAPDHAQRPLPLFAWVIQRLMAFLYVGMPDSVLDEMVQLLLAIEDTLNTLEACRRPSTDPFCVRDMLLHAIQGEMLADGGMCNDDLSF